MSGLPTGRCRDTRLPGSGPRSERFSAPTAAPPSAPAPRAAAMSVPPQHPGRCAL